MKRGGWGSMDLLVPPVGKKGSPLPMDGCLNHHYIELDPGEETAIPPPIPSLCSPGARES